MDTIDHVYYINLDYRSDRRLKFEDWIEESGFPKEKVTRISGIPTPGNGILGCTMGHIRAIKTFLESSFKNCIIFEDDYVPLDIPTFWQNFQKLKDSNLDYDLVMGSYNVLEYDDTQFDFIKRVKASLTASAYLITRDFAPKLIEVLKEGLQKKVEREAIIHRKADEFSNDVYWQKLMPLSNWYCFYPRIGIQRESYSDIQGHVTAYNA
jgi:GR25 family glycosyltransferase involved in LPS biosynthesis